MCPFCIIAAVMLGSSATSASGIHWVKRKLRGNSDACDGCQTLRLSESPAGDEPPDEAIQGPANAGH